MSSRSIRPSFTGRKRTNIDVGHNGSDTSYSSCKRIHPVNNRVLRGFKKLVAPQRVNSLIDTIHDGVKNEQSAVMLNAWCNPAGSVSPWIMQGGANSDQATMATVLGLTDVTYGAIGNFRKYKVDYCKVRYRIKNQHNFPVKITLYDIQPRRDALVARDPLADWRDGIDQQQLPLIGAAVSNIDYRFPGATPFQSPYFTQYFKVLKKTTFMLHPGSEHQHYLQVSPAYMFDFQYHGSFGALKGLTTGVMMVMNGGIGSGVTLTTEGAYSSGKIACIAEYSTKFMAFEKSRPVMFQLNGLNNVDPADPVRAILEDSDIPAVEADA